MIGTILTGIFLAAFVSYWIYCEATDRSCPMKWHMGECRDCCKRHDCTGEL
jgi:hypothetical protein